MATDQDLFAIFGQIHDLTHKAVEMMSKPTPDVQMKIDALNIDQMSPPTIWTSSFAAEFPTISGLAEISGKPDPVTCPTGRCGSVTPKDLNGMLVCPRCYARIPDA